MSSSEYCVCPIAGICTRHGYKKTDREHEICRGIGVSDVVAQKYRKAWEEGTFPGKLSVSTSSGSSPRVVAKSSPGAIKVGHVGKPGTELKNLLSWFGKHASAGCSCTNHARQMDQRGCDWCEQNIEVIKGWLTHEASKSSIMGFSLDTVPGFDLSAELLIRKAIANAREKQAAFLRSQQVPAFEKPPLYGQPLDRSRLVKNLVYHIMPLGGEAEWIWRRHCQWIREVRDQFNGRAIIGIATESTHGKRIASALPGRPRLNNWMTADDVQDELAGLDCEFIAAPNKLAGEGVTFLDAIKALKSIDPDEVTFYGHSKGVARYDHPRESPPHWWAVAMFDTVMRNPSAIIDALDSAGVAGSFRTAADPAHGDFPWHFSGTFWAFRHIDVFRRNWNHLGRHYGCVEMWPKTLFSYDEVACVFGDQCGNLYDQNYWLHWVQPRLTEWRKKSGHLL